jgi:hypothetical protein
MLLQSPAVVLGSDECHLWGRRNESFLWSTTSSSVELKSVVVEKVSVENESSSDVQRIPKPAKVKIMPFQNMPYQTIPLNTLKE